MVEMGEMAELVHRTVWIYYILGLCALTISTTLSGGREMVEMGEMGATRVGEHVLDAAGQPP